MAESARSLTDGPSDFACASTVRCPHTADAARRVEKVARKAGADRLTEDACMSSLRKCGAAFVFESNKLLLATLPGPGNLS